MECDLAEELLSARLDDQCTAAELAALDQHLAGCAGCRQHEAALAALHRASRVRSADPVPDLSRLIMAKAHPPRPGRGEWVRVALAVVALTQLVLALPALLLGDDVGATVHVARHVGSFSVALAIGMAYAAWRPERAFGLLPSAAALAGCTLLAAGFDVAGGRVGVLAESAHVMDVAALVLLWLLAGAPRPSGWVRGRRIWRGQPALG